MTPVCYDLYCGLGGWTEGFLSEGYRVIGFDIERHDYGTGSYPGELVLRDVRSIHGSELKDATVIVASPPCQAYSYRAMPWKRAKALPPPDNTLFDACFRIQREASEAAGRYVPLIVENVRGAQKWVGRARWHFGSYFLWGDVPALMPPIVVEKFNPDGTTHGTGSWFKIADSKHRGARGLKQHGSGAEWYDRGICSLPSASARRKAASALIAKIPFPLAQHIARVFKEVHNMTYVIETRRTVNGPRYYIRLDGKLMRGGFARRPAAVECIRTLQVMDQDRAQLRGQIQTLRQERTQ